MGDENKGTDVLDIESGSIMPPADEILRMVEERKAEAGTSEDATNVDSSEQESQAATDEESTDESVSNESADDSDGEDGESGDEQVDGEAEGEKKEAPQFYSAAELESLSPNQIDMDRVRPGLKGYVQNLKKKYDAADGKFRDAAEERKANEAILALIEENRKQAEQQRQWREEDRQQQHEAEVRRQRQERYEKLLETYDADTARLILDSESSKQAPQKAETDPEILNTINSLKSEVERLTLQRNSEMIGNMIDGAIKAMGVDDSAKRDVFERTHKSVFAQWADDQDSGRAQTPIEDIVARVVFNREKELEAYRKQLLEDKDVREQIAAEERKKIFAELKKKKAGGEKNVTKPSPKGGNAVDGEKPKIDFDTNHPDGIWQGLEIPQEMVDKFMNGKV